MGETGRRMGETAGRGLRTGEGEGRGESEYGRSMWERYDVQALGERNASVGWRVNSSGNTETRGAVFEICRSLLKLVPLSLLFATPFLARRRLLHPRHLLT